MKTFHISDVLTVTTGRLLSNRHIEGAYSILNFLTGDSVFTHQIPRAMDECGPWLRAQFPQLFPENPTMKGLLEHLDLLPEPLPREEKRAAVDQWVETVRITMQLPVHLPVYEMGYDMHTSIDPVEELEAMVGKNKVLVVDGSEGVQ